MKTVWRVNMSFINQLYVSKREVERETEHFYYIDGEKYKKESNRLKFFDEKQEAYDFALKEAASIRKQLLCQVDTIDKTIYKLMKEEKSDASI